MTVLSIICLVAFLGFGFWAIHNLVWIIVHDDWICRKWVWAINLVFICVLFVVATLSCCGFAYFTFLK